MHYADHKERVTVDIGVIACTDKCGKFVPFWLFSLTKAFPYCVPKLTKHLQ